MALDAPELLEDPRYSSYHARTVNVEEARRDIQLLIGKLSLKAALERLEQGDVPCAPVRTAAEVMTDQHFWDRGSLLPMNHGALESPVAGVASGFPVIFSGGPLPKLPGAPTLGMHNEQIFGDLLGLSPEQVRQLEGDGVV